MGPLRGTENMKGREWIGQKGEERGGIVLILSIAGSATDTEQETLIHRRGICCRN